MPNHPSAHKDGFVHIHTLQAEKLLKRHLKDDECVHHIDKNKLNNKLSNLMVFASRPQHTIYHKVLNSGEDFVLYKKNGVYSIEVPNRIAIKRKNKTFLMSICPRCGNIKEKTAALCINCYNNNRREHIPSKEILIEEIKTYNLCQIGRRFGVTDSAVKKWLKSYNLPFRKNDIKSFFDKEYLEK